MWYFIAKLLSPHNAQRSHCHVSVPPQSLLQVPALTHHEPTDREKVPASSLAPLPAGRD